jgi:hypothetical protein
LKIWRVREGNKGKEGEKRGCRHQIGGPLTTWAA